ncbi:MAG: FAD-binding domain-containing protein [Verrucomicrobiota bacterium]
MQDELFTRPAPVFAATRKDALDQLDAFISFAGRYARDRNHVLPGHTNVSKLSSAIRHRLILESECAAAPLRRYAASTVEKFTQEVYWRRYWKNWLSLRPQIWTQYLDELATLHNDPSMEATRESAARCEACESPIAIMNHYARELIATGYLHNHARMWFAGWWINIERLPWQLGSDFFLRHLLDGDPASNTLSWRWVAGLQTPGKTYLPRRSNLEKYLPSKVLEAHHEGLEQLEHPQALIIPTEARPAITRPSLPPTPSLHEGRIGIWIHEEDLLIEQSPLASLHPKAIIATRDTATWTRLRYPEIKTTWLQTAIDDAAKRASNAFGIEVEVSSDSSTTQALLNWASEYQLQQIAAMRPEIGPLHDQLATLQAALSNAGIELIFFDRPEDLALRPLATSGFFGFWQKMQKLLEG